MNQFITEDNNHFKNDVESLRRFLDHCSYLLKLSIDWGDREKVIKTIELLEVELPLQKAYFAKKNGVPRG